MNRVVSLRALSGAVISSGLLCISGAAHAQLEEMVVTAQKVESDIQRTPIAISAISGEELQKRQVSDVESLMKQLPNVDFGIGLGTPRLAIRGVGFDNISGGNEGRIAFHQDGVYYSRPASALSGFYDIDRIEALRGPQGTLYGRNATGGVINVITREPGDELNGYATVTAGNYELLRAEGAVGGRLSDSISARAAFQIESRDGYGRNETTGSPVDDKDVQAMRLKLRYEPSENFNFTLSGDYMQEDDHAYGYVFLQRFPETDPTVPGAVAPQLMAGELFGGSAPSRVRNTAGDVDTQNDREFSGISGTANLSMGDLDLVSITAWRWSELMVVSDLDQTSAPIVFVRQDEKSRQFSEELRLHGTFDRGDWMLGAYYFKENIETGNRLPVNGAIVPFFRTYNPDIACPPIVAPPAVVPPSQPRRACTAADLAPGYVQGYAPWGVLDTQAYAVFANMQFDFTEQWSARVGLRYSDETKEIDELFMSDFTRPWPPFLEHFSPPPPLGPPNFANSYARQTTEKSYTSVDPSFTLSYQATEASYLYASYSRGFKSGGFNVGWAQPPFAAEEITAYEVGLKADWFDRRLRTNLAAFYYDYNEIQATRLSGTQIVMFNAPGAGVQGAELEIQAAPTSSLSLEANLSWLDSEYDGPFSTVDSSRPWVGVVDLEGNQLTQAAKYTANLAAQYTWSLPLGELSLRAETQYKDRVYLSVFNLDHASQPAHWISNAYMNFTSPSAKWSANLFVRNIEDEIVRVAQNNAPPFFGSPAYGAYAPPRTYGLEIGFHFE